jgi:hypothetical protein
MSYKGGGDDTTDLRGLPRGFVPVTPLAHARMLCRTRLMTVGLVFNSAATWDFVMFTR